MFRDINTSGPFTEGKFRNLRTNWTFHSLRHLQRMQRMLNRPSWPWPSKSRTGLCCQFVEYGFLFTSFLSAWEPVRHNQGLLNLLLLRLARLCNLRKAVAAARHFTSPRFICPFFFVLLDWVRGEVSMHFYICCLLCIRHQLLLDLWWFLLLLKPLLSLWNINYKWIEA